MAEPKVHPENRPKAFRPNADGAPCTRALSPRTRPAGSAAQPTNHSQDPTLAPNRDSNRKGPPRTRP